MNFCDAHRLPRAHVDPLDDASARLLIGSTLATPRRRETVIVFLDDQRCGTMMVHVEDTGHPDAIYDVAELAAQAAVGCELGSVILATVRPGARERLDDAERWLDLDERFARVGVDLIEWYVFGRMVTMPREMIGASCRWDA